jgi:hypothetical protein
MRTISLFAILLLLCSCARRNEEIQPTEDSILNRVSQNLRRFTESETNSLEYFEAIFNINFAIDEYRNLYDDNERDRFSDLLHAELSEGDLEALYDSLEKIYLWNRLPIDSEFELMVERGAISETPPEYQISCSNELRSTIYSADQIFVYEGYPRLTAVRDFDFESFSHEGQDFTLPKRRIGGDGIEPLRDLLGTEQFFADFGGDKACGGFHADYMVEWDLEGSPVRAMICNGCYEIIITYKDQWFKHDFAESRAPEIMQRMARFDQKRTQMREAMAPEKNGLREEKDGLSEEEKAEIRAAMKGGK